MKFASAALLLCSLTAAAQAPAKRPMTFADLMAMKRVSDPQISPSGKWVLFSVTDVSLEKNSKTNHLWIVPLDGSAKERQLTSGNGESNGRFSPDGKTISLTMKGQIFEMPWNDAVGKVGDAIQVTNVNGGADGAIWSPDSKLLMFTVDVYPECSNLEGWAKEDDCDIVKEKAAADSDVKAQIWTQLLYRHWNAYTGERRSHIAIVDSDTGRHLRDITPASVVGDAETPTFALGGPLGYAWSPDSKEIAYVTNLEVGFAKPGAFPQPGESTNNDIFTLQVGADPHTAKKISTSPGSDDGPQYSPDGKYLAWRSQARNGYESDKFDLVVMERSTLRVTNLTSKFDGWVDEFNWVDDSQHLFFTSGRWGSEPLFHVNVTADSLQSMGKGNGEWSNISNRLVKGRVHIFGTRMWADRPSEIWNIDSLQLDDDDPNVTIAVQPDSARSQRTIPIAVLKRKTDAPFSGQLTHVNEEILNQINFQAQESFWFPGANGTKVQGFLVKPPNFDPAKKYPVKFLIHGGPQGAWGDAWSYRWNPELFAANGYVVVMVNPRGSTGYGQKFLEQVSGDWGGRSIEDLMRGLDYAEQHYPFIDKNRECALGASYGGFAANWLLTHTNRFKCIVTHDGMYNPQSAFGTTEELWFNEWEFHPLQGNKQGKELATGDSKLATGNRNHSAASSGDAVVEQTAPAHPWDFYDKPASQDPFRKWSPMLNIKNAHTPTLVVHGQRDYRLDVSEGFQLFTALQLLHVPSKMLYFPDEGHWVLKPKNSELWYETVNDWCDRWTGTNKYASLGPEKNPAAVPSKPAALDRSDARKTPAQHPDN